MTLKKKVGLALTGALLALGAALTGAQHATHHSVGVAVVSGVAVPEQTPYIKYRNCMWTIGSEVQCDLQTFGETVEEDDEQGRWYCDLRGNRYCGDSED